MTKKPIRARANKRRAAVERARLAMNKAEHDAYLRIVKYWAELEREVNAARGDAPSKPPRA